MKYRIKGRKFGLKLGTTLRKYTILKCPHKLCYASRHYASVREDAGIPGVAVRQDSRIYLGSESKF
jgi:hypothetical protein